MSSLRIPARSRSEAMDWSLVLVSQGIESTIQHTEETPAWGLLVTAEDYERALYSIEQYQSENRGWPWQQAIFRPGLLFDWGSLAWVALVTCFFWLDAQSGVGKAGIMDTAAVSHGQWWRLFTGIWLHADLAHLAGNATLGFVLLGLAMGRFGTGAGLLAGYLAGVGGNAFAWLFSAGQVLSLGASGMVMGSLGLLAVPAFSFSRRTPQASRLIAAGLFAGVMLFVLLGLNPGTHIQAHVGGFLSGLAFGALLTALPVLSRNALSNLAGGLLFTLLVIIPWWLALRA